MSSTRGAPEVPTRQSRSSPGRAAANREASSRSSRAIWVRRVRRAAPSSTSTSNGASGAAASSRCRIADRARSNASRVLVELERPVRAHPKRVQLERELARIDVGRHVAGLLRVLDRGLERHQPLAHHARDLVAHRPGAPVELERRGREEAPAAEHLALHVAEPGVRQREDLLNAAADAGRCDDLVQEHLARRLHGRDLQVDLRPEVARTGRSC